MSVCTVTQSRRWTILRALRFSEPTVLNLSLYRIFSIYPYQKAQDAKVIIWALFAGNIKGPIHVVDGTINAEYYTHEMLAQYLLDF